MRCLLLLPPIRLDGLKLHPRHVPFITAGIASYLEARGVEVSILDSFLLNQRLNEIMDHVGRLAPEVVGVAPYDYTREVPLEVCHRLAGEIKGALPGCWVGLYNGPSRRFMLEELEHNPKLDFAVIGDGEVPMAELCGAREEGRELKSARGICFRNGGAIGITADAPPPPDPDELPLPARHLLPLELYHHSPHRYRRKPFHSLLASRGCPYSCTFCNSIILGHNYRARSVPSVVAEMRFLVERHGAREIQFVDATFGANRQWLEAFCDTVPSEDFDLVWSCLTRVDRVDGPILRKMARAGCWNVLYGVESGNQQLIDRMHKGTTLQQAITAIELTREAGIESTATFMLGLPGETPEMGRRTIEFAKKLNPDYASFFVSKCSPDVVGFSDVANGADGGRATPEWDLSPYDFRGPIFVPDGYSGARELLDLQRRAYRDFYLRPAYILRRISKIRGPEDVARLWGGFQVLQRVKS